MHEIAPANPLEMLAYILSLQIEDHSVVYVGTGLPMVAGILARMTHAPHITMVYESGGQDPIGGGLPWSVGCPFTWRKAPVVLEMAYSFGQCANGYVDIAFLGFAQVDRFGNVNTHHIGDDLTNPKVRLTGSGGNNDLTSLTENMVLVGLQTPEKFPARVDFITSVGHLDGGISRQEAGLLGNGPVAVVTQCAVYDFDEVTRGMRIKSLHPGMSVEIAQACTGFDLLLPAGDIPATPMPDPEILQILRQEVDPNGVFTALPAA